MKAPPVRLDFVRPRVRVTLIGAFLLVSGGAAIVLTLMEYRALDERRAGLELKLDQTLRRSQRDSQLDSLGGPHTAHLTSEATRVATELGTPWTSLLLELEAASRDTQGQVAVLSIEPDHEKHRVRISGESRSLPLALAYVERLQKTHALRYPMLDSHEVKADDPERPVRFALTADWEEIR
jgi:hypothetical protein